MPEYSSPQEYLRLIQQRWLNINSTVAETTANLLEDVVNSIFGDAARIGYELLQNADDASLTEGLNIDIEYFLLEEYVVIRHNGAGFSSANIEAICRYGSHELSVEKGTSVKFENTVEDEKQRNLKKLAIKV
jgi:hypothetical protein